MASPLARVGWTMFRPMRFRPPGLMKCDRVICPTCWGWVCPGWVTVTVPSGAMVTLRASWGIVICGCRGKPEAFTMLPFWSRVKAPSLV